MHRVRSVLAFQLGLLAAVGLSPPANAEIEAEARALVDRYLEATGGAEAFRAVRSVRIVGRISAMGMSGTTTTWVRLPDRRATETSLGPLKISEGYDGEAAWRTDPASGKLVMLDGKDLEDARASAFFDNERWLAEDQGGGTVSLAAVEEDSSGTFDVLEVVPPHGRSRRFYVNRKTGLIDRATTKKDQMTIVSSQSDYRPAAGRLYPFEVHTRIVGLPANDLFVTTDSIFVNEETPDSRFAPPRPQVSELRYLGTPGVVRLPIDYRGRHVWLKVSVDGREPADFLYDTGASLTVIDSSYAARIGLETEGSLQGQGAGSVGSASFSRLRTVRVAGSDGDGIEIQDVQVAVLSLNPFLAPFFWRDCAGVIGFDFISRFVNEIDFDAQVLTLRDPKSFSYKGSGARIPFTLAGTVPAIPMTLDGVYDGAFRLDLGSNSTVDLHRPFVARHDLTNKVGRSIEVVAGGFGGTFRSRLARMQTIQVGPYTWKNPIVSLSGAESGALASEDYAGNVGNLILQRFKVTLDYERRVVYLEPGRRFSEPDRFSRAGVQLARFGDKVKAMQVLDDSPAARAGLKEGDEVASIAGMPAVSYTPDGLIEAFELGDVGETVTLEIVRDGKKKKLEIELEEIL